MGTPTLAEKLVDILMTEEHHRQVLEIVYNQLEPMFVACTIDEKKRIGVVVKRELGYLVVRENNINLFAGTFTDDELTNLVEFFTTPTGQSYLDKMVGMTQQQYEFAQRISVEKIIPQIEQIIYEEVEEKAESDWERLVRDRQAMG